MKKSQFLIVVILLLIANLNISNAQSLSGVNKSQYLDSTSAERYKIIADSLFRTGNYDSSLLYFEKASKEYETKKDWENSIYCLTAQGSCYETKLKFKKAIDIYKLAQNLTLEKLSEPFGFPLPKGASSLVKQVAQQIASKDL